LRLGPVRGAWGVRACRLASPKVVYQLIKTFHGISEDEKHIAELEEQTGSRSKIKSRKMQL